MSHMKHPQKKCCHCHGYGIVDCTALNIITEDETKVTAATFHCLPATRADAEARREYYIRYSHKECPNCRGTGLI